MKNLIFPLIFILTVLISSCKTDFDVNAEWKDITVVYGLLNPYSDTQYVKINKCFLGEASAYDMAAVSDSVLYADLTAKLIPGEIKDDGSFIVSGTEIMLQKTNNHYKEPGIFATDNNVLYITTAALDKTKDYRIEISVPGKDLISANTYLIDMSDIENQGSFSSLNLVKDENDVLELNAVPYGRVYEIVVKFNYYEVTADSTYLKYILWPQNNVLSKGLDGDEKLSFILSGNSFLSNVANQIKSADDYNPDVIQRVAFERPIELFIYCGSDDLNTYIEVSKPADGVAQEKPGYTNITNGIGLFTSRSDAFAPSSKTKITDKTYDNLATSIYTIDLKFLDKNGSAGYWSTHP
jgi:hypothetical protein